jgi:hypothetical protein
VLQVIAQRHALPFCADVELLGVPSSVPCTKRVLVCSSQLPSQKGERVVDPCILLQRFQVAVSACLGSCQHWADCFVGATCSAAAAAQRATGVQHLFNSAVSWLC